MVNSWYVMLNSVKNNKIFNESMKLCIEDNSFGIDKYIKKDLRTITNENLDLIWDKIGKTKNQKEFYKRQLNIIKEKMKIGDIVFLCKGSDILAIATITSEYIFNLKKNENVWFPHRRKIKIITIFKNPAKSNKTLRHTIHKV